jgi:hypothetical protein
MPADPTALEDRAHPISGILFRCLDDMGSTMPAGGALPAHVLRTRPYPSD